MSQVKVESEEASTSFASLQLPKPLVQAIEDLDFANLTPIQAQVLPHTLQGRDCVGKAQTGTGKTAAFLLTIMSKLIREPQDKQKMMAPRALVLGPTRELVQQIVRDAEDLGKHSQLNTYGIIGGADYDRQIKALQAGPLDILVATPGRLIDYLRKRTLSLREVEVLVLDEADRMLDMGFLPQVRTIVRETPRKGKRQTMLFSATINHRVRIMADNWSQDPVQVEIEPGQVAAPSVDQRLYMVSRKEKDRVLSYLIQHEQATPMLVFTNTRSAARRVRNMLQKKHIQVGMLSGEVEQRKRENILKRFRAQEIQVLVATDVAGRGIHVDDISHVINYDLPDNPDDYVHRIGRTGRAGKEGIAISFASEDDAFAIPVIERTIGKKLKGELPPEQALEN